MPKDKSAKYVFGALVLVVLFAGIVLYTNSSKPVVVQLQNPNSTSKVPGTISCSAPATGQALGVVINYQSFTTNPPTTTQVADTYTVYTPAYQGGLVGYVTGTSSASAPTNITVTKSFQCGTPFSVVGGNNIASFENITKVNIGSNSGTPAVVLVQEEGAATALVSNAPQTIGASTANVNSVGTGGLVTSLFESIQVGTNYFGISGNPYPASQYSTGQSGFLVVYTYNGAAVSSISVPGAQRFGGTLPPITYGTGQTAYAAFVFPSIHFSQYATPTGPSSGYITFSPQIQTTSSYSGSTQQTVISQSMIPLTNYYGIDGNWYSGQAANLQTGQTLFAATTSSTFITLQHS